MTNDNSNEDIELKDGERIRVPMMFMDRKTVLDDGLPGGLHRPGYRYAATDAVAATEKQMAYDAYLEELTSAWKGSEK